MYLADLHVHTTVSDCSETAEEILKKARALGMTHIAFTDHDTTALADVHVALAASYGIQAIPAVEMSAIDQKTGVKAHILGYGYKSTEHIEKIGQKTLKLRDHNSRKQIEILRSLGYQVSIEEIQRMASGTIYKQHILDYLCKTGQSIQMFGSVYHEILKNGGPADFDITYPDVFEVVKAIKKDGGKAVLAHPGQQNNYYLIDPLVGIGLDGIECLHPVHKDLHVKQALSYAQRYDLFLTGGSDYHGRYAQTQSRLLQYPAPLSSEKIFY